MNKNIVYLFPFQIISILGIIYSFIFFSIFEIVICIAVGYLVALLGELVGLHRYFSHKSFKCNKFWHTLLIIISTLAVSGPIVAWASIHRNHHKHSDTENDPHSPTHRGYFKTFFANWWYYRYTKPNVIPDYQDDKLLKFTHDYYYLINFSFIVLILYFNYFLLFALYFYPSIIGSLISSVVNTYCHRKTTPQDSKILAYMFGDGHHKYHHENSGEATLPFPDPCATLIKLIRTK